MVSLLLNSKLFFVRYQLSQCDRLQQGLADHLFFSASLRELLQQHMKSK